MIGKEGYKSWTITDEFWEKVNPYIPEHQRYENREYKRKAGGGRKPPDKRKILAAIVYVLRTGCQWKSIPKGSNVQGKNGEDTRRREPQGSMWTRLATCGACSRNWAFGLSPSMKTFL
ncbi:hypothetical protein FACS189490_04500 [Clostridia bacterium]|nr:hypothetical protein FACS189490_04500 [Clostridia bacterium]